MQKKVTKIDINHFLKCSILAIAHGLAEARLENQASRAIKMPMRARRRMSSETKRNNENFDLL